MPIVEVSAFKRPIEAKRKVAQEITDSIVKNFSVTPESILVLFRDLTPEDLAKGGIMNCDKKK